MNGAAVPNIPYQTIGVCPVCGESVAVDRKTNKAGTKVARERCVVPPQPHYLGPWLVEKPA